MDGSRVLVSGVDGVGIFTFLFLRRFVRFFFNISGLFASRF